MDFSLKKTVNALHVSRQRREPFSGWVMLIIGFCLLNILQLAIVIHVIMNMTYGEGEVVVQVPVVETVERGRLHDTIADFSLRQSEFQSLQTLFAAPADPSR